RRVDCSRWRHYACGVQTFDDVRQSRSGSGKGHPAGCEKHQAQESERVENRRQADEAARHRRQAQRQQDLRSRRQAAGMLNAAIKACPVFGGTLVSYDEAKVAGMPGVKRVVKVNESTVAVVADTWWHAKTALAALPVVWDEGPGATRSS